MRTGAILRQGDLRIQTGTSYMPQWNSRHFSEILPFVIPFQVSGPDFVFHQQASRWRRGAAHQPEAPWVTPMEFTAGFARRVEAQAARDWSALPIVRSVSFKYAVETDSTSCVVPFTGARSGATELRAAKWTAMVKKLYEVLRTGHVRYGNIRAPLNGDTTRLAEAEGLTPVERSMARRMHFKAEQFPGTQQVRQLMGHRHWGARVNYGDCIFFTISPNEKQSAWVLKLSRVRRRDPYLQYAGPEWTRLCGMDYPELAAKRQRTSTAMSSTQDGARSALARTRTSRNLGPSPGAP